MSSNSTFSQFPPDASEKHKSWFAVLTLPRHEKRVKAHFIVRDIESFLPIYQRQRRWKDGSRGVLQLPLFPSYIFARIGWGGRVQVLETPGVISIIGCGQKPLPVPDSYIYWLQEGLREGKIEPYPYLVAGTKVRIRFGAMMGMEGLLLRRKNSCRVVLSLDMIMKSVAVEVAIEDIEPLEQPERITA